MCKVPAKPAGAAHLTVARNNVEARGALATYCTKTGRTRQDLTVEALVGRNQVRYTEVFAKGSRVQVDEGGHAWLVRKDGSMLHTAALDRVYQR